jgi:type IV pilus assembly protein PilX
MTIPNTQDCLQRQQAGTALIVALVFLIVLAMLGLWAVSNNVLQERMAGNTRNRDLALQAAEAALKDAELTLRDWCEGPWAGLNGLLSDDNDGNLADDSVLMRNDRSFWADPARWTSYRTVSSDAFKQVAEPPRYVVQRLRNVVPDPLNDPTRYIRYYRVTARAVGGDANAVVILQTIISFTPFTPTECP